MKQSPRGLNFLRLVIADVSIRAVEYCYALFHLASFSTGAKRISKYMLNNPFPWACKEMCGNRVFSSGCGQQGIKQRARTNLDAFES